MRTWRLFVALLLCSGLCIAFGLSACGDDDELDSRCESVCNKIVDCEEAFGGLDFGRQECTEECSENAGEAELACGYACPRDLACEAYAACIIACGIDFD